MSHFENLIEKICPLKDMEFSVCIFCHSDQDAFLKISQILSKKGDKWIINLMGGVHILLVNLKIRYKKHGMLDLRDWWVKSIFYDYTDNQTFFVEQTKRVSPVTGEGKWLHIEKDSQEIVQGGDKIFKEQFKQGRSHQLIQQSRATRGTTPPLGLPTGGNIGEISVGDIVKWNSELISM